MIEKIKTPYLNVQKIPYSIPLTNKEPNHACVGKHLLLKEEIDNLEIQTRFREGTFRWEDLPIPSQLLKHAHPNPDYHVWLEVSLNNEWKTIDATWDPGLTEILPVNMWSNADNMNVAFPILSLTPLEEVEVTKDPPADYEDHIKPYIDFFKGINNWLGDVRNSKP